MHNPQPIFLLSQPMKRLLPPPTVTALCIPWSGKSPHLCRVRIDSHPENAEFNVPNMIDYWLAGDPHVASVMQTMHTGLDSHPLGGTYFLFFLVRSARFGPNPHFRSTPQVLGDAMLFKIYEPDGQRWKHRLYRAIYDHVPEQFMGSGLQQEIFSIDTWWPGVSINVGYERLKRRWEEEEFQETGMRPA